MGKNCGFWIADLKQDMHVKYLMIVIQNRQSKIRNG